MSKKISWISLGYLLLMFYLIGLKVYHFFSPNSQINLYYTILRAFDPAFYIPYLLTLAQIIFNVLSLFPLFLLIFQIPFLNQRIWQYLLIFNFIFDLTGHSYQTNEIIGIFRTDPRIAISIFLSSTIPYIPKYIACFQYAFQSDNIFKRNT